MSKTTWKELFVHLAKILWRKIGKQGIRFFIQEARVGAAVTTGVNSAQRVCFLVYLEKLTFYEHPKLLFVAFTLKHAEQLDNFFVCIRYDGAQID